ncbi:MAG TPA: hypothetical protein PLA87_14825 [Pseudomonadota bacterium]|nr:hypothetical protein [Pseudomonadota bacterium]
MSQNRSSKPGKSSSKLSSQVSDADHQADSLPTQSEPPTSELSHKLRAAEYQAEQLRQHLLVVENELNRVRPALAKTQDQLGQARAEIAALQGRYRQVGPGTLRAAATFSALKGSVAAAARRVLAHR